MLAPSVVSVLTALLLVSAPSVWGLRIMSFNVKQFGESKFSNVEVVNDLVMVSSPLYEYLTRGVHS